MAPASSLSLSGLKTRCRCLSAKSTVTRAYGVCSSSESLSLSSRRRFRSLPAGGASHRARHSASPVFRYRSSAIVSATAVDFDDITRDRDACGVGFIASLEGKRTHETVRKAVRALECMEHRGACSADDDSGDGAGFMTEIPWKLLSSDIDGVVEGECGVGMIFLPQDATRAASCKKVIVEEAAAKGLELVGWRDVPVDKEVVGKFARETEPEIAQVILKSSLKGKELERQLYITRKSIEAKIETMPEIGDDCYICSLSGKVVVYKGMLRSSVVQYFYLDLQSELFETVFAIYHRRFSTNTTPKWPLAQPMRFLGHNGEINTLQGNLNLMMSREKTLKHPVWNGKEDELLPICSPTASDSANLDRVAELMTKTGFEVEEAMMILVPEAYDNHPELDEKYPEVKAFYRYYEGLQEGWDGPALLIFSDGNKVGARLDRNGLRPARFWQTDDGYVYVASEVGVFGDTLESASGVVSKGRLGPGHMVSVDLQNGTFSTNIDIAKSVSSNKPYEEWTKSIVDLDTDSCEYKSEPQWSAKDALEMQVAFGYGLEDSQLIIEGMAAEGREPTFCMGDTIALPFMSERPHLLYNYFKQRFAQVTNPAIDPLREGLVMSLDVRIGRRGNLLEPSKDSVRQVSLSSPVLTEEGLDLLMKENSLKPKKFHVSFEARGSMSKTLSKLCSEVESAVREGCQMIVLTDKPEGRLDAEKPAIPMLLAAGAVHHHLIACGLRTEASIVTETAQCFSTHHLACLVGYGVSAVCPFLAFETIRQWRMSTRTQRLVEAGKMPKLSIEDCQHNFTVAINKGLMKILSKMGISLLSCYQGAQIFEIYGLGDEVVNTAFKGTVSRIGGLTLNEVASEAVTFWTKAFPDLPKGLEFFGFIQSRPTGEYHGNNPEMSKLLHKAVGLGGNPKQVENFKAYQEHMEKKPRTTLRDMLEIKSDRSPIPIDQVEPASAIMERFCTGGMSLGAISRETHEVIAIAMNRIGGKSNSGEGGEDPVRWRVLDNVSDGLSDTFAHLKGLQNGDTATSAIKQVASGRFGVTPEFLANASQIEIKVAQGAKPGEGGQLPGKKVSPYIANLRRSKPGVPLISPPPHHDIYSIEDLAQLIFDLHQVQPTAKVSVKLVACGGIGTVASGVAKANADIIQVSGHDGGTGASPISSIKHCGGPLEIGLAETHTSLVSNQLRDRVILRADGGLKSGSDVIMAAALGADEYGFGTLAMIATGCIMARVCHTNNCPVGVATQREDLRKRFPGTPSDVVNFFHLIAEEVRSILANLGYRSLDEIVGRGDLLRARDVPLAKTKHFDASFLTQYAGPSNLTSSERMHNSARTNGPVLDDDVIAMEGFQRALETEGSFDYATEIVNTNRAVGGRIGGKVAKRYGDNGFAGSIDIDFRGAAGQSFGCFITSGVHFRLTGEANDYVCKGMAGGEVVIVPPSDLQCEASKSVLIGNTALYGATGGRLFVNGRAGERFGVRNSLAEAVVEGTGDHCCEYMTGGCVVALGPVGRNVAAGMTGGISYFYDLDGTFPSKVNSEIVVMQRVKTQAGEMQLKGLIEDHLEKTGSPKAKEILDNWKDEFQRFWQLVPPSEQSTPEASGPKLESQAAESTVDTGYTVFKF